MRHRFCYSDKVWALTLTTQLVLLVLTLTLSFCHKAPAMVVFCLAACWLPVLLTAAFAPLYYVKRNDGVVLRLLCCKMHFCSKDYTLEPCLFAEASMVRLFGSGGFLGYYGWYYSEGIGRFLLFSTGRGTRFLKLTHKVTGRVVLIQE